MYRRDHLLVSEGELSAWQRERERERERERVFLVPHKQIISKIQRERERGGCVFFHAVPGVDLKILLQNFKGIGKSSQSRFKI